MEGYVAYVLKKGTQEAEAVLVRWVNAHTGELYLISNLDHFRANDTVWLNFNTNEVYKPKAA